MPAESNQSQLPAEEITALTVVKRDQDLKSTGTENRIGAPTIAHLLTGFVHAVLDKNPLKPSQVTRKPDLISIKPKNTTNGLGRTENEAACGVPCSNTYCDQYCTKPSQHSGSVPHYCSNGHSW